MIMYIGDVEAHVARGLGGLQTTGQSFPSNLVENAVLLINLYVYKFFTINQFTRKEDK